MQPMPEVASKARTIGIVADAPAALQDNGVDGADQRSVWRNFMQQRPRRLFAGVGDVEAGEAHPLGGEKQIGQRLRVEPQAFKIDQPVQDSQAGSVALELVLELELSRFGGRFAGQDRLIRPSRLPSYSIGER